MGDEIERAIEVGWKEFERITYSDRPKWQGGYTPSRGAFEFAVRAALAALPDSSQPTNKVVT